MGLSAYYGDLQLLKEAETLGIFLSLCLIRMV